MQEGLDWVASPRQMPGSGRFLFRCAGRFSNRALPSRSLRVAGREPRGPSGHAVRRDARAGAGPARRPLCGDAGRPADRQGRLGHRHRRGSIHRGGQRLDLRAAPGLLQWLGQRRLARPDRRRQAGAGELRVERHHRPQDRGDPHLDRARQREGLRHPAAADRQPRAHSRDRGAPQRRARSDDRVADPRARQRRPDAARGVPAGDLGVRRPHALRPQARLQAHGQGAGRQGL